MMNRYELKDGDRWIKTSKAMPQKAGWLHYQLRDGTNGLARPGTWRVRPDKPLKVEAR